MKNYFSVRSSEEYQEKRNTGLVIVDLNTEWCGPCRRFAPVFQAMAKEYPEVTFLSVDSEKIDHADCESVSSVPTFKVFLNGELKREFSGVDKERLERYIKRYGRNDSRIQILVDGQPIKTFTKEIRDQIVEYLNNL